VYNNIHSDIINHEDSKDHPPLKLVALMKKLFDEKSGISRKAHEQEFIQNKYFFMFIKILFNII